MASQIPPLLESYLSLPPETSQVVLSGILGASTNWLVLRSLYSLLKPARGGARPGRGDEEGISDDEGDVKVLLVSFMRDFSFWKDGAGRLGLNLETLTAQGRFYFLDGLSRLFLDAAGGGVAASAGRGAYGGHLESPRIADVARALGAAVAQLQAGAGAGAGRVVLVLDQPDVLLAAAGAGDGVTGTALGDLILDLREKVHATIITVAADEPLVSAQTTSLEKEHAAFVLSLAHGAEAVLSLRLLDTGTAKDVSGVVRITRGGGALDRAIEEHEYLYNVGGDGGVKVFERGQ
ncbi:hypothetical protein VPNG_02684 [Cytospora leucostoma]|uniref:Elongator complex protein 6 n=1 Tax=Cytospora leucostoma TaxID=1230097 RepID=A0A423XJZ6_9PEZI|nr:hypothetical protein VPNG_02684 [Cytospora leucostoma]